MPDQYGVVTKQLEKIGLANQWHVVDAIPCPCSSDRA